MPWSCQAGYRATGARAEASRTGILRTTYAIMVGVFGIVVVELLRSDRVTLIVTFVATRKPVVMAVHSLSKKHSRTVLPPTRLQ